MGRRSRVWVRQAVYGAAALVLLCAVYVGSVRMPARYADHTARTAGAALLPAIVRDLQQRAHEGEAVVGLSALDHPELADEFFNRFSIEWHGSAPDYQGTRIVCTRNGEATSTLTVQSLHDGAWIVETTPAPAWWQIWR